MIGGDISAQRPGYMGKLAEGFDARVVDEDDQPVPDGEAGELILRADLRSRLRVAISPWRRRQWTLGATSGFTQAIESCAMPTAITTIDRLNDAIRRRGENISSFEVEQVLLSRRSRRLLSSR